MNAKHTPGPWFLDVDGPGWDIHVTSGGPYYCEGSRPVAVWYRSAASRDGHEERFANARLMAAAPAMLAALTTLRDEMRASQNDIGVDDWIAIADEALSQASGEAQ